MANDFGNTNGRVIGQKILETLVTLPVISNISTNFGAVTPNGAPANFGQEVSVPLVTAIAAADYHTTNGYVATDSADTDATVTINKHKHVTRNLKVDEAFTYGENVLNRSAAMDANALAKQMVLDLMALIVNPGVPDAGQQSIVAAGSFGHDSVVDINTKLDGRDTTEVGRFGILNSTYHGALRKDSLVAGNNTNAGSSSVSSGVITDVDGVDFFKFASLPGNSENLTGIVATMDALAIATILPDLARIKDIPNIPMDAAVSVVTEPKSGLSLLVVEKIDSNLGTLTRSFRLMYGVGLGNTANIEKIASA